MWIITNNTDLQMTEGDYGIQLPVEISGTTLTANDSIRFTLKAKVTGREILTKEYDEITENTINLELTEEETAMLPTGAYLYSLDWYQSGLFMCNIIPAAPFKVVDKI